jgi:hypothetical protein
MIRNSVWLRLVAFGVLGGQQACTPSNQPSSSTKEAAPVVPTSQPISDVYPAASSSPAKRNPEQNPEQTSVLPEVTPPMIPSAVPPGKGWFCFPPPTGKGELWCGRQQARCETERKAQLVPAYQAGNATKSQMETPCHALQPWCFTTTEFKVGTQGGTSKLVCFENKAMCTEHQAFGNKGDSGCGQIP